MEKKNTGLIVLVIILSLLVVGLGGFIVYDKVLSYNEVESNDNTDLNDDLNSNVDNNDTINNYTEQELINSVKMTKFTFDNPRAGSFGGGPVDSIIIDTTMNLDCSNNNIVGITLSGYCFDTNNNKYMMGGPVQVMAFYCDNNMSHTDSGHMMSGKVFDSNGNEIDTAKIKYEEVNIKYCKVDSAKFVGTDGEVLPSLSKELNYEKKF